MRSVRKEGQIKNCFIIKNGRPCVLILKLKYKGKRHKFVVPIRSNISSNTPKKQYFSLPTNSATKTGNRHGLHYIKLFPIDNKYIQKYRIDNNNYMLQIKSIIDKNEKEIVTSCQNYQYHLWLSGMYSAFCG